jgi:hypothetical protein
LGEPCPHCQFQPKSGRELSIAALLTERFEAGEATYGTPVDDLRRIQAQIRDGAEFNPAESDVLRHQLAVVDFLSVKPVHLVAVVLRLFLPALALITALFGVALFLKFLRHLW